MVSEERTYFELVKSLAVLITHSQPRPYGLLTGSSQASWACALSALPSLLFSSELAPSLPYLSSCSFLPSLWERRPWKPLRALVCTSRNPQDFNMTPGSYKAE